MKKFLLYISLLVFSVSLLPSCSKSQQLILGVKKQTGGTLDLTEANIIGDGHSYVQGNGYTPFTNYLITHSPFSSNGATVLNYGAGGQTSQDMLSDLNSQIVPQFVSGALNILIVQCTGNYTYYYGDETADYNYQKTYCQDAKTAATSAGKSLIVIVITSPHRDQTTAFGDNPSQFNTKIDNINSLIRTNYATFCDAYLDQAAWTEFASYTSGYYDADKVHPNQSGQNLTGQRLIDLITSL